MTYHIRNNDYKCTKCEYEFIAYKKDVPCPNCGEIEKSDGEGYDFIEQLVQSLKAHKIQYGQFHPPAWLRASFSDEIQSQCYKVFDYLAQNKGKNLEDVKNIYKNNPEPYPESFLNYEMDVFRRAKELYDKDPVKESWFRRIYNGIIRQILD